MSTKAKKVKKTAQAKKFDEDWKNLMKKPFLEKVVLNIGVGTGGEDLEKAVKVLEHITGRKAVKTVSKTNVKEFNLRVGRPIGAKVTIRRKEAEKLLKKLLIVNNNKILRRSFDYYGNFGFGITEHIAIPGVEYDADIGIFGLDVCGRLVRPGMRVKNRKQPKCAKIPKHHYVSREEAQYFLEQEFDIEVVKVLDLEFF